MSERKSLGCILGCHNWVRARRAMTRSAHAIGVMVCRHCGTVAEWVTAA